MIYVLDTHELCTPLRLHISAFHDRQLRGRLADSNDVATDSSNNDGTGYMRDTSDTGTVLLSVDN